MHAKERDFLRFKGHSIIMNKGGSDIADTSSGTSNFCQDNYDNIKLGLSGKINGISRMIKKFAFR